MSFLKPVCKLCGKITNRSKRKRGSPVRDDIANHEFNHYEVVDNYYYRLVTRVADVSVSCI